MKKHYNNNIKKKKPPSRARQDVSCLIIQRDARDDKNDRRRGRVFSGVLFARPLHVELLGLSEFHELINDVLHIHATRVGIQICTSTRAYKTRGKHLPVRHTPVRGSLS